MKKFFSTFTLDQIRLIVLILIVALFIIGAGAPSAIGGIGGNNSIFTFHFPFSFSFVKFLIW